MVLSEHLLPVDQQHDLQDQQREREHLEAAALTALNQLSEDNRQALTLYYLGGYTTEFTRVWGNKFRAKVRAER